MLHELATIHRDLSLNPLTVIGIFVLGAGAGALLAAIVYSVQIQSLLEEETKLETSKKTQHSPATEHTCSGH